MKAMRIIAWGSDKHPDLDYEADVVDDIVRWNYPCLNITLQRAVTKSAIMNGLKELDARSNG